MKTTGFSRVSKELIITELSKELKERPTLFVAQHGTLSASGMDKLRVKLRAAKGRYFVVKGSLAKRAVEKAKLAELKDDFKGACGIALSSGDPVASSKILVDFAKENEVFKIQRGYVNGAIVSADQIKTLASLPSKEVLIARAVVGVAAPLSRFVGVLSGTVRKVVNVFDAIAKKKGSAS
jgi:large subunit ribosomal protein L10